MDISPTFIVTPMTRTSISSYDYFVLAIFGRYCPIHLRQLPQIGLHAQPGLPGSQHPQHQFLVTFETLVLAGEKSGEPTFRREQRVAQLHAPFLHRSSLAYAALAPYPVSGP